MSRWASASRVPCTSTGLGSKIVCSIDEKVAQQRVFCDEVGSADVGSVPNMLRICKFMCSFDKCVLSDVLHRCFPNRCFAARFVICSIYLLVPATCHLFVSEIKPCMPQSENKTLHGNTANGSSKQ